MCVPTTTRVGLIGYGGIGQAVASYLAGDSDMTLAFVATRSPRSTTVDPACPVIDLLDDDVLTDVDLVVEAAHPEVVHRYGARILRHADLMTLSTGALVDDTLRESLVGTAHDHGTRLLLPHGALAGLESLLAGSGVWQDVTITFVKPPGSIEPVPSNSTSRVTLYDGPVRGIAKRYPRNVNSMVTCALASVGLDHCRARLISDPDRSTGSLELLAHGQDGSTLHIHKEQPMRGVSGTEMAASLKQSLRATAGPAAGLAFV